MTSWGAESNCTNGSVSNPSSSQSPRRPLLRTVLRPRDDMADDQTVGSSEDYEEISLANIYEYEESRTQQHPHSPTLEQRNRRTLTSSTAATTSTALWSSLGLNSNKTTGSSSSCNDIASGAIDTTFHKPSLRKLRSDEHQRSTATTTLEQHKQNDDLDGSGSSNHLAVAPADGTSGGASNSAATVASTPAVAHKQIELNATTIRQLLIGISGIYASYLYYGHVQEDLFRYRNVETGRGFSYFWALQMLESAVTMVIGYIGRTYSKGGANRSLPLVPFFKSGASQLVAKALMSMSLAAGLSFPVVTLAKSAKIVPVMLGQFLLGGSSYSLRDYTFAILIVVGTALLSAGKTSLHAADHESSDTLSGLILIAMSLIADGFTGGLQKALKQVTATMAPTTYDFLYYSHMAQLVVAAAISAVMGELYAAPTYLLHNPSVQWLILASCICSAVGQCFIFYVISCFDPLVCTTITTTRKMFTVLLSIGLKGHILSSAGCLGLGLACTALLVEVEGKVTAFRRKLKKDDPLLKPLLPTTSSSS